MELPKNILDKIQKIYSDNPQGLNIIEEQIDLDIQMNYFKRSGMLKKHVFSPLRSIKNSGDAFWHLRWPIRFYTDGTAGKDEAAFLGNAINSWRDR